MFFVDLKQQYHNYQEEIGCAIESVLQQNNFIMGLQVKELEEQLRLFVGVRNCITVANGTDALLIALMSLGVGRGDEVITVPLSWVSTVEVIRRVGAEPVFVDIDPNTYTMDPKLLEGVITERTKAIIPVSLYGQVADMSAINEIAARYDIPVVEDGAQSFGATMGDRLSGGLSTIGCTSFFPAKPLGGYGDGGAIFTDDDDLAIQMRMLRSHGGDRDSFDYSLVGLNSRLDTIQAVVLLVKLKHFNEEISLRRAIAGRYSALLEGLCETPFLRPGSRHVYYTYTIRSKQRDDIMKALHNNDIPAKIYYPKCLHLLKAYASDRYFEGSLPCAEMAVDEILSLPMHPWLTEQEQDKIVGVIKEVVEQAVCI